MLKNSIIFYPNMLKTYSECPYKYRLKYLEKINIPMPSSYFVKGKKIHALAHYYLSGQDITKLGEALNFEETEIFQKLCENSYFKKCYVNSEYNLSANISGYWLSGRLDALMKDESGYYILDYKTGSVPKNPQYDFQTISYLLILDEFLRSKGDARKIQFVYIDLKNNRNVEVLFDANLKAQYKNIIENVCAEITKDTSFDCKKSDKCASCEYSKICNV